MNNDTPGSNSAEKRSQARSSMFLAAVMRAGKEQAPVKVRNMSSNGAMVETPLSPVRGTSVDLMRGPLLARGLVIWSSGNRCGLRFASEVSVRDWLAAPIAVHQQRVDEMIALVRAGGLAAAGGKMDGSAPHAARSNEQLGDDLGVVLRLMSDLEDDLASSEDTMARHGMKLQNLDIAMQMLRAVAAELTSGSGGERVSLAKLQDLRVAGAKALGT